MFSLCEDCARSIIRDLGSSLSEQNHNDVMTTSFVFGDGVFLDRIQLTDDLFSWNISMYFLYFIEIVMSKMNDLVCNIIDLMWLYKFIKIFIYSLITRNTIIRLVYLLEHDLKDIR